MSNKNVASLIVKLGGESTIDVNTLINLLTHYTVISNRVNDIMGEGVYKSEVKVQALTKGSFEISLQLVSSWLQNLFSKENVLYASSLVVGIYHLIELLRIFKGRKVTAEEIRSALNLPSNQDVEKMLKLYQDAQAREAARRSFDTAQKDEAIENLQLIVNGISTAPISKEELSNLSQINPELEIPDKIHIDNKARLQILSLSFNRNDSWKFVYNGNKIVSRIIDEELLQAINQGARFSKGDALEVELEIIQRWSQEEQVYLNVRYKINKVLKHIHATLHPMSSIFTYQEGTDSPT